MGKYTLNSNTFPALADPLYGHKGTGNWTGSAHVVDPTSVNHDVAQPFKFKFAPYAITVMSVEIAAAETPNWFAVSFRQDINVFDTVHIFCHPSPGGAGMIDKDYALRSGNWPKLFRYAEIFGRQIAIAKTNHITIVPFFTNASYESTGIFGANWKDIVEQILVLAKAAARAGASPVPGAGGARVPVTPVEPIEYASATRKKGSPPGPPAAALAGNLKHVVLSDFSHGRKLMWNVRTQASGISRYLREVWDFDGVHGAPPYSPGGIIYNQSTGNDARVFQAPPERWQEYHHAIVKNVHGDIPAMLACHSATISRFGH